MLVTPSTHLEVKKSNRHLFLKLLVVMGLHLSVLLVMILAGDKYYCHSSKILHCVKEHISLVRKPTVVPT